MRNKFKLLYGVGVNDADYPVVRHEEINGKSKQTWKCPFYDKWQGVLERCYSQKFLLKKPSYMGCDAIGSWHYFSGFKAWMETQDWEGKHLDKDLLIRGNKIYSPETCIFVSPEVNTFITESDKTRGNFPIGVCFHTASGKFSAQCMDVSTKKSKHLGLFTSPEQAHQAWLSFKLEQAKILASQQTDPRVAVALISRYKNYQS